MPQVPYSPVPTVAPSTQQPRDYIDTQASPLDFGAQVGGAEEKLGNTLGQTGQMLSQHALAFQQLDNENLARDAGMKLAQGMGQAWADYRQKEGKDAYDSYPGFVQNLQSARQAAIDALPNPQAKELLSAQSAYLVDRWQMMGGTYSAEQRKEWMVQSHKSNQATAVDQATLMRNDPQSVIAWGNSLADSVHQEGQLRGWSDDQINANIAAGKGALYRTVIGTLAAENPAAASKLFDQVKGQLDGQSVELITRDMKGINEKASVAAGVQTVMGGVTGGATPAGSEGFNYGNIRPVGGTGFNSYATPAQGVAAISHQLSLYAAGSPATGGKPITTLADLAATWAPKGDGANDPVAYAKKLSSQTDIGVHDPINLADPAVQAKVVPAIANNENSGVHLDPLLVQQGIQLATGKPGQTSAAPGTTTHSPEAFGAEAGMMNRARDEAQQRFPDRPDLQKALVDGVWQEIQQNNALQMKYEAETQKQQRDAQEAAGQNVMKALMTPGSNYNDLTTSIRDNPTLTWEQKNQLWNITAAHYGGETAHDVKTYGSGFWNLYQQVHAPQDDPNRITDVSQLWQHGGPTGDLTLAGIEKLTGEIQGRRTPDGEAAGKMQQGALAYAKHELSFEADLGMTKIRDPKGEGIFNINFLPAFFKAYDAGVAAGKSPYQLLSKDSPDFIVDKLVSAYKRTPAQIAQDMLQENDATPGAAATQPAQQQQFDLNTQTGILGAYHTGKMTREQASAALIAKGFARAAPTPAAAPAGPRVPTSE